MGRMNYTETIASLKNDPLELVDALVQFSDKDWHVGQHLVTTSGERRAILNKLVKLNLLETMQPEPGFTLYRRVSKERFNKLITHNS